MTYCTNCGSEIIDGGRFCPNCGQPVEGAGSAASAAGPGSTKAVIRMKFRLSKRPQFAPKLNMSISVNGLRVWTGTAADIAEFELKTPSDVCVQLERSIRNYPASADVKIDPAEGCFFDALLQNGVFSNKVIVTKVDSF